MMSRAFRVLDSRQWRDLDIGARCARCDVTDTRHAVPMAAYAYTRRVPGAGTNFSCTVSLVPATFVALAFTLGANPTCAYRYVAPGDYREQWALSFGRSAACPPCAGACHFTL